MNLSQQMDFLVELGNRLDEWTAPGDENDRLGEETLWTPEIVVALRQPSRVIDVLLARFIWIKDFTTQQPVSFCLNPAQQDFSRNRTGEDIVTKAGRAGFTSMEEMRAFLKTICNLGYTAVLITHALKYAEDYFIQVRYAFEHFGGELGAQLRAGALRTEKKSAREIYFPELNSHMFVETAGQFAPAEGDSIQYLIADEMARWRTGNPQQVITTLLSHCTGENTTITMMSRPFGQTGEFYNRYWEARRGEGTTRAHFYQWWWNLAQQAKVPQEFELTDEERTLLERYARWRALQEPTDCGLPMALPLGSLQWRQGQRFKLRDLFAQEFAEDEVDCFLGSGNCPFDGAAIDRVLNDLTPVLERRGGSGESENGLLRWVEPNAERWYVMFIDPAGGLGSSRIAIEVIDGETGEQAAEWVGRDNAYTIAAIARDLVEMFLDRVLIAVELNMGEISATIVGEFRAVGIAADSEKWPRLYREQDPSGAWRNGWKTSPTSRPMMLDTFAKTWRDHPELFHSARLAREVKAAVRSGDRIEHGKGATDDLIMAMAGAHEVRGKQAVKIARPAEPWTEALFPKRDRINDERIWTKQTW